MGRVKEQYEREKEVKEYQNIVDKYHDEQYQKYLDRQKHYIKIQFLENKDDKISYEYLTEAYLQALELLNASVENNYDIPKLFDIEEKSGIMNMTDEFDTIFEILSSKSFGEKHYETVKVNLDIFSENDIDIFLENFLSFFQDNVEFLWKFHDTRDLQKREDFFRKIYFLEMDLREVFSYIFFKTYLSEKDLLKDLDLKKFGKKIYEMENDFFDISFSAYKDLLNLRKLKDDDREKYLQESSSFDDWKNKLLNRGVQEEIYRDFIASVNDELSPIEEFRNCIMHNRGYEIELFQVFERNYTSLYQKIENFRDLYMNEKGNENDLLIGKEYISLGNHKYFTKGEKYKLKEIGGFSDAIFEGDDGNEYVFRDKDFHEHWQF